MIARSIAIVSVVALLSVPCLGVTVFNSTLTPLNNSTVSGTVTLTLNDSQDSLRVQVQAAGLTPNESHPMHIHAFFNPSKPSTLPGPGNDLDGDGVLEGPETEQSVGPPLLFLYNLDGEWPTADSAGNVNYDRTFILGSYLRTTLLPLTDRAMELHGMVLGTGGAGTPFENDGTAGYKSEVPVAVGLITSESGPTPPPGVIPEPLTLMGLAGGLYFVGNYWRKRR